jgi:hypothetical protein
MKTILFLLEEPSAKDLLQGLLPKIATAGVTFEFLVFEGKQDLERNVARKIAGWQRPATSFVILRDQDAGNCVEVKQRLVDLVPATHRDRTVVRVACRELESWALGDWNAIASAYNTPRLASNANKRIYRQPDNLANPVGELRKFLPEYQKRDGARRLGPLLDPDQNRSNSFRVFCAALRTLTG